jgi:CO/xanthine dehydrogenase Mo-binding subunit
VEHAYLEVESALCQQRPDGVMEIYAGMQHPFSTRRFTAAMLGRPLAEVEVIGTPVGGGFGGKGRHHRHRLRPDRPGQRPLRTAG